jgi:tetratricopeptide (TPR) repeat protein
LIRPLPPATPDDIARAEEALGRALPAAYASFLLSFDGADLFHETVVIAGVGRGAARALLALPQDRPGELVFAEALWGDRYALDADERVLRYDPGADERALAGSSFDRWLDATIAREQILFGPDGEYAPDVFDPSGQEVTPTIALRQAERALKVDPGAADVEHARGLALVRLGRRKAALAAFRTASELDTANPWPLFDLGRTALALDEPAVALPALRQAAAATRDDATAARVLAWAVRAAVAADDAGVAALRAEALSRDPHLVDGLMRAASAAGEDADDEARAEELALLEALAPGTIVPRRLPVIPH